LTDLSYGEHVGVRHHSSGVFASSELKESVMLFNLGKVVSETRAGGSKVFDNIAQTTKQGQ
jgi:hypothetical protein